MCPSVLPRFDTDFVGSSPLVSRPIAAHSPNHETETVIQGLEDPHINGVLLVGPAGSGKTRIVNGVVARLGSQAPVLRIRGAANLRHRRLGVFEVLLTAGGGTVRDTGADHDSGSRSRRRALGLLGRILAERFPEQRPYLIVDNGSLVDEESLSIMAALSLAGRIRLLFCTDTVTPPVDLVARLWTSGRLHRVDLAPAADTVGAGESAGTRTAGAMGTDEVRALFEMLALAEALPYPSLRRLHPAEVVDEAIEDGNLRMTRGRGVAVSITDENRSRMLRTEVLPAQRLHLWTRLRAVVDPSELDGRCLFGVVKWGIEQKEEFSDPEVITAVLWANARGRYREAVDLARAAGSRDPDLLLERARAERGIGDFARARGLVEGLVRRVEEAPEEVSSQFLSRLASLELRLADPRDFTEPTVTHVLPAVLTPRDRGRILVTRARLLLKRGDLAGCRTASAEVYGDHSCTSGHRTRACAFLGIVDVLMGRIDSGLAYLEQAELMLGLPGLSSFDTEDAAPQIFIGRFIAGRWESAMAAARLGPPQQGLASIAEVLVAARTGRTPQAASGTPPRLLAPRHLVGSSRIVRAALARVQQLREIDGTDADLPEHGEAEDPSVYAWWSEQEATLLELQTKAVTSPVKAAEAMLDLGRSSREAHAHSLAAQCFIHAAVLGNPLAAQELDTLSVDGTLGTLARAVSAAASTDDPSAALQAARSALEFGDLALCRDLAERARLLADRAGDAARLKESRGLLGHSSRALQFGPADRRVTAVLTTVEQSLVDGVLDGRSNLDLAGALHLSPRTVEWHLSRIYRKLHVGNRAELRAALREFS